MKKTKVAPFKAASIVFIVLAAMVVLLLSVIEVTTSLENYRWLFEEDYPLSLSVRTALYGVAGVISRTLISYGIPVLLLFIGFIFFYKKGKSAAIFGAAFLALACFKMVLLYEFNNSFVEYGYIEELKHYLIGYDFLSMGDKMPKIIEVIGMFSGILWWCVIPLVWFVTSSFAAANCFTNVKLPKTTIGVLLVGQALNLCNYIMLICCLTVTKGKYLDALKGGLSEMVFLFLFNIAAVFFFLYRNAAKKDVDTIGEEAFSYVEEKTLVFGKEEV